MVLLAAVVGLVFVIAAIGGAWMYFSQVQKKEAAARAKIAAQIKAKKAAEPSPEAQAENQAQLEAARKAHADIMAGNAGGAGSVGEGKAVQVPPLDGPARAVAAPVPASTPLPVPASIPAVVVPPKPVGPAAAALPPVPVPDSGGKETATPAATNAEAPIGPGGCMVSGSNPQDYGTALGRCLEEFNRMEAAVNEAARNEAAKAGGSRPPRR
jgi:hypothetical protein